MLKLAHMYMQHPAASATPLLPTSSFSVRMLVLRPSTMRITLHISTHARHDLHCYVVAGAPLSTSAIVQVHEPLAFTSEPLMGCASHMLLSPLARLAGDQQEPLQAADRPSAGPHQRQQHICGGCR